MSYLQDWTHLSHDPINAMISDSSKYDLNIALNEMLAKYGVRPQKFSWYTITCEPGNIKVHYEINIGNCREFPLMYSIKDGICFGEIDIYEGYDKKSVKKVLRLLKDYKKISHKLYALLIPYLKEEF